jgi:hypothetical protein
MANKKFSEFTLKTDSANVDFVVGYDGSDNVRIAPSNLSSGGASSLNGLSDVLIDTASEYVGTIPSGLSGNPQGNTTLGIEAGLNLTSGGGNSFVGDDAGKTITTGARNVALGQISMSAAATGINDTVAVGYSSGSQATGSSSVHVGRFAAYTNQASGHISIGQQAGLLQTSGVSNTNIGYQAGFSNTTGGWRTMFGYQAGKNNTGSFNVFMGTRAVSSGTGNGIQNVMIGYEAGKTLTNGSRNTAIGNLSMTAPVASEDNVAIGHEALKASGSKYYNTAVGSKAGDSVTTGQNLTMIGYDADASSATATNEITLGDANIATLRCQVQTISALSDSRDKTNVQPSPYGLDLISQLQPVTFDWNMRDGAKVGQKDLGFIAQELQEVDDENLQLVYDNNPDRLEASYGRLIPVLVQAIKELKAEVELLKA